MNNPCNGCPNSKVYYRTKWNRFQPGNNECKICKEWLKYEAYKEKRRMFKQGKSICSLQDFIEYKCNNNYVYWYDKLLHIAVIESWQFRLIEKAINSGCLFRAILKESENNKEQNE